MGVVYAELVVDSLKDSKPIKLTNINLRPEPAVIDKKLTIQGPIDEWYGFGSKPYLLICRIYVEGNCIGSRYSYSGIAGLDPRFLSFEFYLDSDTFKPGTYELFLFYEHPSGLQHQEFRTTFNVVDIKSPKESPSGILEVDYTEQSFEYSIYNGNIYNSIVD